MEIMHLLITKLTYSPNRQVLITYWAQLSDFSELSGYSKTRVVSPSVSDGIDRATFLTFFESKILLPLSVRLQVRRVVAQNDQSRPLIFVSMD